MKKKTLYITKASGEKVKFSMDKVAASLRKAGTEDSLIKIILDKLKHELYEGITTREIYNRAFNLLKEKNSYSASRYKLKKALYELGPTGFPFEKFIGAIFRNSGFTVQIGKIVQGKCVKHEVDIVARDKKETHIMECKFHSDQGKFCDVKTPLYIHSRFNDILNFSRDVDPKHPPFDESWVVTNTRFSHDAILYSKCVGLNLLSWDLPKGNSLKDRIDHTGLYPITVSTLLSQREKQFLLSRDVVLCKELIDDDFYLDHLDISAERKSRILLEMNELCNVNKTRK